MCFLETGNPIPPFLGNISPPVTPELSVGMTLLFWTVQVLASGSGPYTFEQTYDEAKKEGLVPRDGDFDGTYRF